MIANSSGRNAAGPLKNGPQDPEIQKATGKTDPVEVMAKLREMKNSFK